MIKKKLLVLTALVFFLGFLAILVNEALALTETTPVEKTATVAAEKIDYYLAYPGILPDHFLYPIKMIRDRILLFLTTDPLKKTELLLLFADKRLGAAKALIEGGKHELGVTTAMKAEIYLERALNEEKLAREKGKSTLEFQEKLLQATLKHEETLLELTNKVSGPAQASINNLLDYSRRGAEKLQQILGQ